MKSDNKRRDAKGRVLRPGESWRSDGRYMYRFIDNDGNRQHIYSRKLVSTDRINGKDSDELSLRELEKDIQKDLDDNINLKGGRVTVNEQFLTYISTKTRLAISTRNNYMNLWENHIKDSPLGQTLIIDVKKSHVLKFYSNLVNEHRMSDGTIQLYQNILYPCFELAVDDDLIRKNPCKGCMKDLDGNGSRSKEALNTQEQQRLLEFVSNSQVYNIYLPLLSFMLFTACRCGETIGLTWGDIDFEQMEISINHQLIYKKVEDRIQFYMKTPKTRKGIRTIPLMNDLLEQLKKQKQYQDMLGI